MQKKNNCIRFSIPGGEHEGAINVYRPVDGFFIYIIDIHTVTIPEIDTDSPPKGRIVKINYCEHGRCELMTKTGEYTYLVGGEVAVDTGQTESHFYYPTSDYSGIEIVVFMDDNLETIPCLNAYADVLQGVCLAQVDAQPRPLIFPADEIISRITTQIRTYDQMNLDSEMMLLKGLELLTWIAQRPHDQTSVPRRFYTLSQIEIARSCFDLINADLSIRWTAKALAEKYGISESSVKNYFRNVYGFGFQEYQNKLRMERAADLLSNCDQKVREIAHAVGYTSQIRFSETFEKYFGCLPLEFRRRKRL